MLRSNAPYGNDPLRWKSIAARNRGSESGNSQTAAAWASRTKGSMGMAIGGVRRGDGVARERGGRVAAAAAAAAAVAEASTWGRER
jgi:hypothetical protein